MTEPTQVTDHATEAVDLLLSQFKGKVRFEAFIAALVRPLQQIETDVFAMLGQQTIATAEGTQLDGIGSLVGISRGGRLDAAYRLVLTKEIELHNCDGTHDALVNLADGDVFINEYAYTSGIVQHAEFELSMTAGSMSDARAAEILRLMNLGRPAGVYFTMTWVTPALAAGDRFYLDNTGAGFGFDGPGVFAVASASSTENPTP